MQIPLTIIGLDTANRSPSSLGSPDTLVHISKDELSDASRKKQIQNLFSKHFR
jgi:hypothetical protein